MTEPEQPEGSDPWQSVPGDSVPQPPAGPVPGAPGAPGYGYGYPPPPPGAVPPYYYSGYQAKRTNGLAIAALVCGICGFLYLIPAILGIVFGCIAVRQIKRDGTDGRGLAIAGIITGSAWFALVVLLILVVSAAASH